MTPRLPVDAPRSRVVRALQTLGFRIVREGNHIAMIRDNADGTRTPLTLPGHAVIKGSTLMAICTQTGIERDEFLSAYSRASR